MTETPIKELRVHKALASLPQWSEDDTRYLALVDDILINGIIEPIKITARGEIVDGRHRWRAAKRLQWQQVPTALVDDENVINLAISTLLTRRHFTRGQLAYVAYPLLSEAHQEAKRLAVEKLRKGLISPSPTELGTGTPKTVKALAERLGITDETFRQAGKLHQMFDASEALRAEWEPKLMAEDGMGLGRALAGIAGQEATPSSKGPPEQRLADGVVSSTSRLIGAASEWGGLSPEWRTAARTTIAYQLGRQADVFARRTAQLFGELAALAAQIAEAKAAHDPNDEDGWDKTLEGIINEKA